MCIHLAYLVPFAFDDPFLVIGAAVAPPSLAVVPSALVDLDDAAVDGVPPDVVSTGIPVEAARDNDAGDSVDAVLGQCSRHCQVYNYLHQISTIIMYDMFIECQSNQYNSCQPIKVKLSSVLVTLCHVSSSPYMVIPFPVIVSVMNVSAVLLEVVVLINVCSVEPSVVCPSVLGTDDASLVPMADVPSASVVTCVVGTSVVASSDIVVAASVVITIGTQSGSAGNGKMKDEDPPNNILSCKI